MHDHHYHFKKSYIHFSYPLAFLNKTPDRQFINPVNYKQNVFVRKEMDIKAYF